MSERDYRLGVANLVLDTFVPGVMMYEGEYGLRMSWDNRKQPRHDFAARLRSDGSWPLYGYNVRPSGGTAYQGIAQMIRYVRDLPRLPLLTWEYWSGDSVKLCTPRTLELLKSSDYSKKTNCVLCGSSEWKRGLDWWSLDGKIGPCCSHGKCQEASPCPNPNAK